jgi:CAAX prenyl protease-like protein
MLLAAPFDPAASRGGVPWRPALASAIVSAGVAAAALSEEAFGVIPFGCGRAVAGAAAHSGFLAIGWIVAVGERANWERPIARASAILLAASLAAQFTTWGGLLYLLVPLAVVGEAARVPALRDAGVRLTAGLRSLTLGLAAGAVLGCHLLLTASLTLGYAVRLDDAMAYVSVAAYDAGANALTAEWLFRGALLSRLWRRWDFWPSAAVSTALVVGRYLLDPTLPSTIEVKVGAVFYMSLLGVTSCALRASSASLLPGYLATLVFFLAYRMLTQ